VWREGTRGQAVVTFVAGADLPGRARWTPAIEAELGGGLRLAAVWRAARTRAR
jgi:hypothetical protein